MLAFRYSEIFFSVLGFIQLAQKTTFTSLDAYFLAFVASSGQVGCENFLLRVFEKQEYMGWSPMQDSFNESKNFSSSVFWHNRSRSCREVLQAPSKLPAIFFINHGKFGNHA